MDRDLVVVGSGPAAWTAGVYAARARLRPLVFEGAVSEENMRRNTLPMGQLALTTEVENFPGFPPGDISGYLKSALDPDRLAYLPPHEGPTVTGPELVELIRQQAVHFGAEVQSEDVVRIEREGEAFRVFGSEGAELRCRAVIVATGASANWLGLPSEERFKNRGVSACAVCDGALPRFRDRPVVVVGGGDVALEDAIFLAQFASEVILVHRRDEFRASKIVVGRVLENPKIRPMYSRVVEEILGDDQAGVTAVRLRSTRPEPDAEPDVTVEAAGVFVLIGHTPNTGFLGDLVDRDPRGYIRWTQAWRTFTSVPGIFAAGDCADSVYRQANTAAATGCMAALDAEKFLI